MQAVYSGDWTKRLCNGCYGYLLSLYEIKAGTASDDEKAEALSRALLLAVKPEERRKAEQLFRTSTKRAEYLSPEALLFIATAEHVARSIETTSFEWSPAVVVLCKALETELVTRIMRPLRACVSSENLAPDCSDNDIGRVAKFCSDPNRSPPELGTFAHFLRTVIHSKDRRQTSLLIRAFVRLMADWPGSQWLLDPQGLCHDLAALSEIRNRATHTGVIGREDYKTCREHVIGASGMIWKLVNSTDGTSRDRSAGNRISPAAPVAHKCR